MNKRLITLTLILGVSTILYAKPNMSKDNLVKEIQKIKGEAGMFTKGEEEFPGDYFLIRKNLPYLVGLTLFHPESSSFGLSKEQIDKIWKVKEKTIPKVFKYAKEIKELELKLAQNIAIDFKPAKSQFALLEKIANLRLGLSKIHLECLNNVQDILSKEQYKKVLTFATQKKK